MTRPCFAVFAIKSQPQLTKSKWKLLIEKKDAVRVIRENSCLLKKQPILEAAVRRCSSR